MTRIPDVPDPFVIESVRHLDWYDGPVTALVSERSTGPWLGFLLATTRHPYRRIFGLVPTTVDVTDGLACLLEEESSVGGWRLLRKRFHIALASSDGPLVLLRGLHLEPTATLERALVSWEEFRGRVTFDDADAYAAERAAFWNDVFDDPPDMDDR